jgi:hypothetical protein
MLHAYVQRFDVTENLKILTKFLASKRCSGPCPPLHFSDLEEVTTTRALGHVYIPNSPSNCTMAMFSSPNFLPNFTMQKEDSHHIKMPTHVWSTKCR